MHDLDTEVVASFGPFAVLFGQNRADEADQGAAVGEDPDDGGAAADLFVQTFVSYLETGPVACGFALWMVLSTWTVPVSVDSLRNCCSS